MFWKQPLCQICDLQLLSPCLLSPSLWHILGPSYWRPTRDTERLSDHSEITQFMRHEVRSLPQPSMLFACTACGDTRCPRWRHSWIASKTRSQSKVPWWTFPTEEASKWPWSSPWESQQWDQLEPCCLYMQNCTVEHLSRNRGHALAAYWIP